MVPIRIAVLSFTLGSAAAALAAADGRGRLALDAEAVIAEVGVACTGIGESKQDPRWQRYPVRLEFANAAHEHLIGATVTVSDAGGASLFTVTCDGPWLLLKFPDQASYRVAASIDGASAGATVRQPAAGQSRVVLTFAGL